MRHKKAREREKKRPYKKRKNNSKNHDTDQVLTLLFAPLFHTTPGPGGELSTTNRSDDVMEVRPAPLVALKGT